MYMCVVYSVASSSWPFAIGLTPVNVTVHSHGVWCGLMHMGLNLSAPFDIVFSASVREH